MIDRVENSTLQKCITSAKDAAALIKNGMTVAMGGYTSSGYPKAIARELVARRAAGEYLKIELITGANVGPIDNMLSEMEIISRRIPMCMSKNIAKQVNVGHVHYVEQQMNRMPRLLAIDAFGEIDVAVVEAVKIREDGSIVPTSSIGMVPNILEKARKIIIEINTAQPIELEGFHDVYTLEKIGKRKPIPLKRVDQRIGRDSIDIDIEKVACVIESNEADEVTPPTTGNLATKAIADNLFDFLEYEIPQNYDGYLPPFQTGFGNIASSIAKNFKESKFEGIQFFCGGINENIIDLMLAGKAKAASTGSVEMTDRVLEAFRKNSDILQDKLIIRNGEITNCGETAGRLGIISLNSGIEVDIYGNVNSSHIAGYKVVNGIGGGANFAQNASLSIVLIPSVGKGGDISNIVPMTFHTDITEHDIDIVITENGVADLRGKDESERADTIIKNCAAPEYAAQLKDYLKKARMSNKGHHPQSPSDAYSWYERLQETGSMLKTNNA